MQITGFVPAPVSPWAMHAMDDRSARTTKPWYSWRARPDGQEITKTRDDRGQEGTYDKSRCATKHLSDAGRRHVMQDSTRRPLMLGPEQRLCCSPNSRLRSTRRWYGLVPGHSTCGRVVPWRRVSGMIYEDNAGTPYTGVAPRATVNFTPEGPREWQHAAMTSGSGLVFGRASTGPFGAPRWRGLQPPRYRAATQFDLLGANGTAEAPEYSALCVDPFASST